MRLAFTHAYSWPEVRRGAERIIREMGRAMSQRGHTVHILSAGRPLGARREDGVLTIRLPRLRGNDVRHERLFGNAIVPFLAAGRYDAVHSMGPTDCLGAIRAQRLGRHRTVYTQLGLPFRWAWENHPHREAHERVVRDVDVYGGMSHFAVDALRDDYGREGTWLPGGVNFEQFRPAAEREPVPTILFSGALDEPRKGVATLLDALPQVAAAEPRVQLWLSGPGDATALLKAAPEVARHHTTVLPLGDPDGQSERYGRAWVSTLPSKYDSFGMVLIEALACGTPIVASTHSALPELVQPGVTGELCEPDDPASLAKALLAALELSQKPGTTDACRSSAAQFDWDTGIAPTFEKYYEG